MTIVRCAQGADAILTALVGCIPRAATMAIEAIARKRVVPSKTLPRVAPMARPTARHAAVARASDRRKGAWSRSSLLTAYQLSTTPPMRRPIKGWGGEEPAACIDAPADSLRAMQAISRGALPGHLELSACDASLSVSLPHRFLFTSRASM